MFFFFKKENGLINKIGPISFIILKPYTKSILLRDPQNDKGCQLRIHKNNEQLTLNT